MFAIRQARLPDDRPAFIAFIKALQEYEAAFESNRRLDDTYAEEHYDALVNGLVREGNRAMAFVAEDDDGRPVGWAVVHEQRSPIFITEDERRYANLAELFVEQTVRGRGIGQGLMAACEEWALSHGFSTLRVGLLARNHHAAEVYAKAGFASYSLQLRKRLK